VKAILAVTTAVVYGLVCDDKSLGQTAKLVKDFMAIESRLHLLVGRDNQGLGPDYLAAFKWGLECGY
jgi:hypothetical protein